MICIVKFGEKRLDAGQIVRPRFGEDDGMSCPRQERNADVLLKLRDDPRHGGLGQAHLPAGAGKAAGAGDAAEKPKCVQSIGHLESKYSLVAESGYPLSVE